MKKIGLFPGTFNNFHNGHLEIIIKSLLIFDKLYVVIAKNKNKKSNLDKNYFNVNSIIKNNNLKNVKVIKTTKKIPILFDELNCTHVIRGIRNSNDLEYEISLIDSYKKMNKNIQEIFFSSNKNYRNLSSSTKCFFVFDIDGTLLNDKKKILSSTKIAISKLIQKGHEIILCTGRAYKTTLKIARELKVQRYLIASGGSVIYNLQNDQIETTKNFVSKKDINLLVDLAQKYERELIINNGKKIYRVYFGNNPINDVKDYKYFIGGSNKNPKYDEWELVKKHLHKNIIQVSFKAESSIIQKEIKNVKKLISKNSICFETSEVYIDLLNIKNGKYNALKKIFNENGIDKKNIYTFGDSENDYEMLTKFPNGVAMDNARDFVKKNAKFVIGNNNENSISKFINEMGFLNE